MINDIIPFYNSTNVVIEKSKGCYLFDSLGKKYIDFESGVWCANIGFRNEKVVRRIKKQVDEIIHHGYRFRNKYAEKLSIKLQQLIGFSNGASVFLSSGSEAVNLSITLARHITGRKKILKISNSYLSAFGFGLISDENENLVNIAFNNLNAINEIDFGNIAAFVVETGGASVEMVRFPDAEFLKNLVNACRKKNCLIIAEEVTTGMGRLGKWFGFQHYAFIPDMVVAGKGLGNGYPISSLTISNSVLAQFEKNPFRYAQSHQNDPLGCAVALETIKFMVKEGLVDKCRITGEYFKNRLETLHKKFPDKIKDIRAKGLMLALEFQENVNGELINNQLFEMGIITGFKLNILRFLPPLIITNYEIDKLVVKLEELMISIK